MPIILVVDDSPVDRRMVGGLLSKSRDLTIQYAVDGADALVYLEHATPDVIITDMIMPNMDGLELVAAVTSNYPRIPVVLMTGQGSEAIATQALRAGATSYVPKIALAPMLVETVDRLVDLAFAARTQERLMVCMEKNDLSFNLDSDLALIPPLVNYLHGCLKSIGLTEEGIGMRVCVALEEALNNAIYHGNLELSSDLRETPELYRTMINERRKSKPYCDRTVHVEAKFSRHDGAFFRIRDQGPGFDTSSLPDPTDPANLERPCGRGVMLMRTFMDDVCFNPYGNEVTLVKRIDNSASEIAASLVTN